MSLFSLANVSLLIAALSLGGCNSDSKLAAPEPPSGPPPELRGSAIRLNIDLAAGRVTVGTPSAAATASAPGLRPSFALLGRNEIEATITNLTRSAVGAFTPGRARVRFDLSLSNKLHNADLIPATFPAPPPGVAQIVAFPFATDPASLFGLSVIASSDWDGAPHNFFNDAICIALTPPGDCFRWEAFGPTLAGGATTGARTVGFDVVPWVTSFTVYLVVAADLKDHVAPAVIAASELSPIFTGGVGGTIASHDIQVTNTGGGGLAGLQATVSYPTGQPTGWLAATLSSTTAPATLTLAPSTAGLAAGTYTATVALQSPDASNSPLSIAVTLVVASSVAAHITPISGDGQFGSAGATLAQPLVVRVTNASGQPVAGYTVAWSAVGGSVSQSSVQTDADGNASVLRTLGLGGFETTSATAAGLAGSPVIFSQTVVGATVGHAEIFASTQSAAAGSLVNLTVRLSDASNNPIVGHQASCNVGAGGGVVSPALLITDALGEASFIWQLGPAPGINTLTCGGPDIQPAFLPAIGN